MEVPIFITPQNNYGSPTVSAWEFIWFTICEMSYTGVCTQEEIITKPGVMYIDACRNNTKNEKNHSIIYSNVNCHNRSQILLDTYWSQYSGEVCVVPEFKKLHVPKALFEVVGVYSWFKKSFPNCVITYWESDF